MLEDAPVGSPKWWLRRLDEERTRRAEVYGAYRDLVDDAHPQPESAETSKKFARMAGLSTTNLMGLAAEATAERMSVEGIRIGEEPEADKDAWKAIVSRPPTYIAVTSGGAGGWLSNDDNQASCSSHQNAIIAVLRFSDAKPYANVNTSAGCDTARSLFDYEAPVN